MNKIRYYRSQKGITQEELAARFGLNRSTVAKWECGSSLPKVELLIDLADYFGCTVDEILRGGENNANDRH